MLRDRATEPGLTSQRVERRAQRRVVVVECLQIVVPGALHDVQLSRRMQSASAPGCGVARSTRRARRAAAATASAAARALRRWPADSAATPTAPMGTARRPARACSNTATRAPSARAAPAAPAAPQARCRASGRTARASCRHIRAQSHPTRRARRRAAAPRSRCGRALAVAAVVDHEEVEVGAAGRSRGHRTSPAGCRRCRAGRTPRRAAPAASGAARAGAHRPRRWFARARRAPNAKRWSAGSRAGRNSKRSWPHHSSASSKPYRSTKTVSSVSIRCMGGLGHPGSVAARRSRRPCDRRRLPRAARAEAAAT